MELWTLILIAVGLTFDTFAVSVTAGLVENKIKFWQAVKIAVIFAAFQGGLPVIGWFLGEQVSEIMEKYDHYIAFVLLLFLGGKMIYEAVKKDDDKKVLNPFDLKVVISLGIATSIDALIIGFSFAFLEVNIWLAMFIIAAFTFLAAMIGMLIGKKAGHLIGDKAEIFGGVILIAIGVKILLESIL